MWKIFSNKSESIIPFQQTPMPDTKPFLIGSGVDPDKYDAVMFENDKHEWSIVGISPKSEPTQLTNTIVIGSGSKPFEVTLKVYPSGMITCDDNKYNELCGIFESALKNSIYTIAMVNHI